MLLDTAASIFVAASSDGTVKAVAWLAIGAGFGVILFLRGFHMLRYKQLILNTPFSKVRSASMGLVEVSGAAQGPRTIPAGITGVACYYYRARAWQLKQSGRSRSWQCVADESLSVPFFVVDPTGRMLVDPQGAHMDIQRNFKDEFDTSFLSSNFDVFPENVARFLNRNNISLSRSTRVEESCIKPQSPLFVFGTLDRNSSAAQWTPSVNVSAATSPLHPRLNFFGRSANPILSSLLVPPRSTVDASYVAALASARRGGSTAPGVPAITPCPAPAPAAWSSISMDEEDQLGASSRAAAIATAEPDDPPADDAPPANAPTNAPECADLESCPPVAICKGPRGDPFMISVHSQREVVRSLAWKSGLCIWGGPVLTLTCFYLLALILGWT